tara:strand:- start:40 stop:519 length:480 start_codon:yes stop_codon:yes gene_type:complete
MTKYLTLLLLIGLAWGKDLNLVSSDGKAITIRQAKYGFFGETLYLNGIKYVLKDVNQKKEIIKVKKVYRTVIGQLINYNKYQKIPFDSVYSFRYIEQRFNIIPLLIGGGVGVHFFSKGDFASAYFGTIPAFSLGLGLSFLPKFSEELIVGNGAWSIEVK